MEKETGKLIMFIGSLPGRIHLVFCRRATSMDRPAARRLQDGEREYAFLFPLHNDAAAQFAHQPVDPAISVHTLINRHYFGLFCPSGRIAVPLHPQKGPAV